MMDLDELKGKWAEHDRKLDEVIHINRRLLKASNLNGARSAMQRVAAWIALEAVIQFACVVGIGSFLAEHIAEPRFAVPAAALQVFAVGIFITLIRQITLALQIDYGKPIATIQKQLETLRMLRARYTQAIFLTATLVWAPLFIVALKAFVGLDAYHVFGAAFLWSNVAFGAAMIPLGIWSSRRFADSMDGSPIMRAVMRDILGRSFATAEGFVAAIAEFEKE